MDFLLLSFDYMLHIDSHLAEQVALHGPWIYGIIALIIFSEVGLVIAPFLPGDSMLFVIGGLCATDVMELHIVLTLFPVAATAGVNFNRAMGGWVGEKAFRGKDGLIFNKKNLKRAHNFYEKFGTKSVVICFFIPFLRTYIPFVAGITEMKWDSFLPCSILGSASWVVGCTLAGFFFCEVPFIKDHYELVILSILVIFLVLVVIELLKKNREKNHSQTEIV